MEYSPYGQALSAYAACTCKRTLSTRSCTVLSVARTPRGAHVPLCVLSQAAAVALERCAEAEARAAEEDAARVRAEESSLTEEQRRVRLRADDRVHV